MRLGGEKKGLYLFHPFPVALALYSVFEFCFGTYRGV